MDNSSDFLLPLFKKHWLALALAGLGLIFFIYGLIALFISNQNFNKISFETASENVSNQKEEKLLAIDIAGAVELPGVYRLKEGSIVQDALVASGGLSSEADRDWVAKNLNLAAKLYDSQKIYIPKIGEGITTSVLGLGDQNLININTASIMELDTLPGIGKVTAEKIINSRPFIGIEDLINKKIVSEKVFNSIKDKIVAQ